MSNDYPRGSDAAASDYVSVESVLSGKHPLLAEVKQHYAAFWIVQVSKGQIALCTVRLDDSGAPTPRLNLAFRCRADRLTELCKAFEKASAALGVWA